MWLVLMLLMHVVIATATATALSTVSTDKNWDLSDIGLLIPDQYLISLRVNKGESINEVIATLQQELNLGTADFRLLSVYPSLIDGLGEFMVPNLLASLSEHGAKVIKNHSLVRLVEQDRVMGVRWTGEQMNTHTVGAESEMRSLEGVYSNGTCQQQSNPPWGLSRINQRGSYSSGSYFFNETNQQGEGVDVYVLDTGIFCEHDDFISKPAGSCSWGYNAVDNNDVDANGHGTHCAGTVGSSTYGVAKSANVIAVKVLNRFGAGSNSDIIDGVNWIIGDAAVSGRKAIASMSLGGSLSQTLNAAVNAASIAGVMVVVAAGNDSMDACDTSPASAEGVMAVGASDKGDNYASYSNYGQCVAITAPGSSILSTYIGSTSATAYLSGTSMAAPHVAGAAAVYFTQSSSPLSSSEVSSQLLNDSTTGVLKNIPNMSSELYPGTPNSLLFVQPCGVDSSDSHEMSAAAKSIRATINYLSYGFVLIVCFNFGLQTTPAALRGTLVNDVKFGIIILIQSCTVPLLCLIFTKSLHMHYENMVSVFFVSMFPGGAIFNLILVPKGQRNFRLSAVITFLQNVMSVGSIPVVTAVVWSARPDDVNESDISLLRLMIVLLSMLLSSLIGLFTRQSISDDRSKGALTLCRDISTAVSIFLLLLVLLLFGGKLARASITLWVSAILVQLGCGFAGAMTAVMFNSKTSECLTVGTEFAFRNGFLAVGVVAFSISGDLRDHMMVFCLIYSFVSSVVVLALGPIMKLCLPFKETDLESNLLAVVTDNTRSDGAVAATSAGQYSY